MLRIKLILSVIFLISFSVSSQNYWMPETTTSFSILANTQVTAFVDANGVHIAYYRNGGIKYALVNSNGAAINGKYDKVIESEGAGTNYVNVAAIDNNVYVIYFKNNKIQVARSTNLGDTWNNNFENWQMSNYGCDAVTAYLVGLDIHIVWTETRVNGYQPETHYVKYVTNATINKWQDYKKVSDVEPEGGSKPDVAISTENVHVSYIPSYPMQPKSRTRLSNGTWENPEAVPFYLLPYTITQNIKPTITGSNLNEIYRANFGTIGSDGSYIGHSYRPINSSTWSQNPDVIYTKASKSHLLDRTTDNKIHVISFDEQVNNYVHRTINGTTISGIIANVPFYELTKKLVSNSNDLYLLHAGNTSIPYPIFFRHYDAAPLAPANYSVAAYQSGTNYYPRLTWSLNNEPDVRGNSTDAYKIERRTRPLNGTWSSWSELANLSGTTSSYIDYSINNASGGDREAEYRITAIDIGDNTSSTQSVIIEYGQNILDKMKINGMVSNYALDQNYPNPFNPSTKISYSIKEEGLVTLKVYDVLGNEVATLVNENKPAGNYAADFNSSQLPTGIYIYKLQAGDFVSSKKMILLK